MKDTKSPIPTVSYPKDHKLLAAELDKVLSTERAKQNLMTIDRFLAQVIESVPAKSRPHHKAKTR